MRLTRAVTPKPARKAPRNARLAAVCMVLVSALLVMAQAARLGHLMFATHAVCEHGAVTHEEHVAAANHVVTSHQGTTANPSETPDASDHDHCDVCAVQPAVLAVTSCCLPSTLLQRFLLPDAIAPSDAQEAIARLSLAPKISPPA